MQLKVHSLETGKMAITGTAITIVLMKTCLDGIILEVSIHQIYGSFLKHLPSAGGRLLESIMTLQEKCVIIYAILLRMEIQMALVLTGKNFQSGSHIQRTVHAAWFLVQMALKQVAVQKSHL